MLNFAVQFARFGGRRQMVARRRDGDLLRLKRRGFHKNWRSHSRLKRDKSPSLRLRVAAIW